MEASPLLSQLQLVPDDKVPCCSHGDVLEQVGLSLSTGKIASLGAFF